LAPAAAVAYVGEGAKEHMLEVGFDERKLVRLPYTTDVAAFRSASKRAAVARDAQRAAYGFEESDLVAIAVLKLNAREGLTTLLDGFHLAVQQAPRLRLLLVGSGPLADSVSNHPSATHVRAIGYRPLHELPALYALADCFIHPAPIEPWGVSVVEAFACELPQILSDGVGAARELLRQGENGFMFEANNVESLADALCRWATLPPHQRTALRTAASASIETFEYEYIADSLFDFATKHEGSARE
jgi:glycosyltransferase involved in cell wall biosynthesis